MSCSSRGKKRPMATSITQFFTRSNYAVEKECVNELPNLVSSTRDSVCTQSPKRQKRQSGFDPSWSKEFPWVKEVEGGMLCTLCIKHQRRPKKAPVGVASWVDVPCTWLVKEALHRHGRSETHNEAKSFEVNRLAQMMPAAVTETSTINLMARIAAFRNLYWLMKQELPHTTNYIPLNELCKLQGASIINNLHQGENDKAESMRFIQEAVLTLGRMVQEPIIEEIKASPWYSVLIDETTDVAVISEMIIYIRYMRKGASRTEFLAVLPLPDGKADTVRASLVGYLTDHLNLDLKKMCAFGSDGASVMVGKKNGVAAQIKESVPHLVSNHCVAHRLALAVGQAARGVPYLPKFKDIIGDLHRFYAKSPVRMHGLQTIQELLHDPVLKLVDAKDVRWLSHDKATSTLRKCLPSVFASLDREAQERNDVKAAGLSVFTQDYRFVMSLHMMCDVLPHLTSLSCSMQKRDAVYTTINPLVRGTISLIEALLDTPGEHYKAAADTIRTLREKDFNVKVPKETQLQEFHDKIYIPFLTNVIQNLEDRFPDLPLLQKFGVFDLTCNGDSEIRELAAHFQLDQEEATKNWIQVKAALQDLEQSADQTMRWIASNLSESHVPLWNIACIGLLIPTSTADCERGFSTLKRIKTEQRNRLSNKVLNSLLAVSLQGPPIDEFNFKKAVTDWYTEKPRRSSIFM